MPFKSLAQEHWMFAKHPEMASKWASHTPNQAALPEKISTIKAPKAPTAPSPWTKMKGMK